MEGCGKGHRMQVHIVGGGLAGSEAAHFLASHGVRVILHEMRPLKMTPAHGTDLCAELVCSNSFKSKSPTSAPGMLKAELKHLGSLILKAGVLAAVPAGEALAVDRDQFSRYVTEALKNHSNIEQVTGEVHEPFKEGVTLLATGPLTSDSLSQWLCKATTSESLYFYDAIAPIVDAMSIDMESAFLANRYDKGDEAAYINCPLNQDEYYDFVKALLIAEKTPPKPFEEEKFFQGCQPIEAIAASGRDSLRFGPMKPVGLMDPRTGQRPFAVVQLRPENRSLSTYNLVGFQTKLKYGAQKEVFSKIPALRKAEFLRLGSIHRNTYVCGPQVLRPDLSLKGHPRVYLAGQITGVEGYLESAACGLLAGIFILERLRGKPHDAPPANTALGSLLRHVVGGDEKNFQPSNMHFGLLDPLLFDGVVGLKRDEARATLSLQAIGNLDQWWGQLWDRV